MPPPPGITIDWYSRSSARFISLKVSTGNTRSRLGCKPNFDLHAFTDALTTRSKVLFKGDNALCKPQGNLAVPEPLSSLIHPQQSQALVTYRIVVRAPSYLKSTGMTPEESEKEG